jgi:hypothetical protein
MGKPQYQKLSDMAMKDWCVRIFKKLSSSRIIPSGCFIVKISHFQLAIQNFQLNKLLSTRTVSCYWKFIFTYFTTSWSSLMLGSCFVCTKGWATVIYPKQAAFAAAQIHALHDHFIWSQLWVKKLNNFLFLKVADQMIQEMAFWMDTCLQYLTAARVWMIATFLC